MHLLDAALIFCKNMHRRCSPISYFKPTILVVDDEESVRKSLAALLKKNGNVITAADSEESFRQLKNNEVDLVLLDVRLPEISGMEILRKIKKSDEHLMVIMITALQDTRTAVEAMKLGAYDYISKPFDVAELRSLVGKALEKRQLIKENLFLHSEIARISEYDELVGESPQMKDLSKLIDKAAGTGAAVLICGESGTGKELIARAIHARGERKNKPFVAVNCAGIPDNLLESEFFGHEPGAFTGAVERKEGKFEIADGGTIFLDEICSMSFNLQAKLLRVLQERKDGTKEIERVGSSRPIFLDVRVISATNKDIRKMMDEGRFREDLYFRLNVLPINIPPLRERKTDIPLLIDYFLEKSNRKLDKKVSGFDNKAREVLNSYPWPGNVRELKNLVEMEVTLKQEGAVSVADLPVEMLMGRSSGGESDSLLSSRGQLEKRLIEGALLKTKGNQVRAAEILGIHRNTLLAKMRQMKIQKDELFISAQ
jgi:two-component system response regulator AtoC